MCELDARRVVSSAGLAGVESLVDELRGGGGVGERKRARVVFGHLAGDVLGQRSNGLLADERFVRLTGDAFADGSVTAHAVLAVDDFTRARSSQILLIVALTLAASEDQRGQDGERGPDLDGPRKGHGVETPNFTGKFL